MKTKVGKLENDLLILQNLYAHICLDKKALDRCELNDSVVDPEMSLGYSMSGLDFDQSLYAKKIKRVKKKVKRKNQVDPFEVSADANLFRNEKTVSLDVDPKIDITQS